MYCFTTSQKCKLYSRAKFYTQEFIRRWDNRAVSSSLFTYSPLNYDTLVLPEYFSKYRPNDNCYIFNGRRFTKSALCISCYYACTFHVSSINYSFASDLPIHSRSSANARDREHTVSWNRVKCCTNVRRIVFEEASNRWMTFKVIQSHCRCCHFIGHIQVPISLPL